MAPFHVIEIMAKLRISRAEVYALINRKKEQGGRVVEISNTKEIFKARLQFVTHELIITHSKNGWCETSVRDI